MQRYAKVLVQPLYHFQCFKVENIVTPFESWLLTHWLEICKIKTRGKNMTYIYARLECNFSLKAKQPY